jgi:glycopeptide antibiotics resistance protein
VARTVDLVPPDQIDVPALPILLPLGSGLMLLSWALLLRRRSLTLPRLLTAWVAGWYAVAVIGATLLPMHLEWGHEPYRGYEMYRIIVVPLITMRPSDFVLNTVMTLPLAALLYLVAGVRSKRGVVLAGFLLSLTIELTQGVLDVTLHGTRWADVNDLLSNTLGAWLGYLWFWRAMGAGWFRRLAGSCSLRTAGAPVPDAVR